MQASDFTNQTVNVSTLPSLLNLQSNSISPAYRPLNMWFFCLSTTAVALLLAAVLIQPWIELTSPVPESLVVALVVVIVLGLALVSYHYFADPLIRYTVREQDIVLFKGLFFKQVICQPILRIQHIDIQRGPIDRLAGLATLKVYSAGGSMHTLAIPGLSMSTAEKIRQFVVNHTDLTLDEA